MSRYIERIVRKLLVMYIKRNTDILCWSISVDDKTDINIFVERMEG